MPLLTSKWLLSVFSSPHPPSSLLISCFASFCLHRNLLPTSALPPCHRAKARKCLSLPYLLRATNLRGFFSAKGAFSYIFKRGVARERNSAVNLFPLWSCFSLPPPPFTRGRTHTYYVAWRERVEIWASRETGGGGLKSVACKVARRRYSPLCTRIFLESAFSSPFECISARLNSAKSKVFFAPPFPPVPLIYVEHTPDRGEKKAQCGEGEKHPANLIPSLVPGAEDTASIDSQMYASQRTNPLRLRTFD